MIQLCRISFIVTILLQGYRIILIHAVKDTCPQTDNVEVVEKEADELSFPRKNIAAFPLSTRDHNPLTLKPHFF